MVQAIVNVPQELPGTSRLVSLGRTQPSPLESPLSISLGGTARLNGSWKTIDSFPSAPYRYFEPGGTG